MIRTYLCLLWSLLLLCVSLCVCLFAFFQITRVILVSSLVETGHVKNTATDVMEYQIAKMEQMKRDAQVIKNRSINQSVYQSVNQPTNYSSVDRSINLSSTRLSQYQPIRWQINQVMCAFIKQTLLIVKVRQFAMWMQQSRTCILVFFAGDVILCSNFLCFFFFFVLLGVLFCLWK